jgi:hypothetical protein
MGSPRPPLRPIHVFIASPGDLAVERRAFKDVIDELNGGFGDGAGVRFVALGWEDTLATTGRCAQDVINQDIDRSDVFVLALHRRWGQEAPDAKPYSSYTEEEFHRAMDRWKKDGAPESSSSSRILTRARWPIPADSSRRCLPFASRSRIPGRCSIASSRTSRSSRPRWTGTRLRQGRSPEGRRAT